MVDLDEITNGTAQDAFFNAFCAMVGSSRDSKPYTFEEVSDATGIKVGTLKSYRDRAACPCWHKMLKLFALFGPDFVTKCIHPAGLGGVERVQSNDLGEDETVRCLIQEANDILQRKADGIFCHRDRKAESVKLLDLSRKLEETAKAWGEAS